MEAFKDMTTIEKLEYMNAEKIDTEIEVNIEVKPEIKVKVKNSELNELKNIKYKTSAKSESGESSANLDLFLENERSVNQSETWVKLDKTTKYKKIMEFVDTYATEKNLTEEEKKELGTFLKDSVDKNRIYKVKDIIYDKVNNVIKEIPGLVYLKTEHKNFTLRNASKMVTLKAMPKKKLH